jgi:hypothetical protein
VWAFWAKVALFGIFEDFSLGLGKCVMYLFISHTTMLACEPKDASPRAVSGNV